MRGPRALAAAAAAALLLAGCGFRGLDSLPLPGGGGGGRAYHVTVEFADVLDLVPRSAVKVDDVTVGTVERVWLDGWHAKVRLRVDDSVRLPDNAAATIRQTSLLGEKFVSLARPAHERPVGQLGDGDLIPLAHSGRNVEVEEVLSALSLLLNGGGVAQLKTIEHELNQALGGREDAVRDLVEQLDVLIGGLDSHKAEIVRAIESLDRLSRTLAAQTQTIGDALDKLGPGLKVLADERADLTRMLTALSRLGVVGTRVIAASKADLIADLQALRPILRRLNQAGSDLPNALELLVTFPFPRSATAGIRGDYTNMRATADLDIKDLYGNLLGGGRPTTPAPAQPGTPTLPPLPVPTTLPVPVPCLPVVGCVGQTTTTTTAPPGGGGGGGGGGGPLCPPICIGSTGYNPSLAWLLLGWTRGAA
jgi:phospholipid/cholesterol/gamma-HCH transport system substrate-binding protein